MNCTVVLWSQPLMFICAWGSQQTPLFMHGELKACLAICVMYPVCHLRCVTDHPCKQLYGSPMCYLIVKVLSSYIRTVCIHMPAIRHSNNVPMYHSIFVLYVYGDCGPQCPVIRLATLDCRTMEALLLVPLAISHGMELAFFTVGLAWPQ